MAEPYCLAMVLSDAVYQDPTTGKFTILGTFSTVTAAEFPATLRLSVYFAITDGLGETQIRLRFVDSRSAFSDEGVAASSADASENPAMEVDFVNPLMVFEAVGVMHVGISGPGLFHCELYAGEQILMSRRLLVVGPHVQEKQDE